MIETARVALPLRPLTALGQGQESGGTGGVKHFQERVPYELFVQDVRPVGI